MHVIPAATIESIMAGPAFSAAATPVNTKMPVPMMAPTPSAVRPTGPSTRLRRLLPVTLPFQGPVTEAHRSPIDLLNRSVGICKVFKVDR